MAGYYPITLRNIAAPDFRASNRLLTDSRERTSDALSDVSNLFRGQYNKQKDENTNDYVNQVNNARTLEQLAALQTPDSVKGIVDQSKLTKAYNAQKGIIQDNINKQYAFDQNELAKSNKAALDPLRQQFASYTTNQEITDALANKDLLKGVGPKASADFIQKQQQRGLQFKDAKRVEDATVKKLTYEKNFDTGLGYINSVLDDPSLSSKNPAELVKNLREKAKAGNFSPKVTDALESELLSQRANTYTPGSNLTLGQQEQKSIADASLSRQTEYAAGIDALKLERDNTLKEIPTTRKIEEIEAIINSEATSIDAIDNFMLNSASLGDGQSFNLNIGSSNFFIGDDDEKDAMSGAQLKTRLGELANPPSGTYYLEPDKERGLPGQDVTVPGEIMQEALKAAGIKQSALEIFSGNAYMDTTVVEKHLKSSYERLHKRYKSSTTVSRY